MDRFLKVEEARTLVVNALLKDGVSVEVAHDVASTWIELCQRAPDSCRKLLAARGMVN